MAITTTGYQTPATSREGLKPSVYDKIILIGADVDPRLAGQGIFYAIEKDIAAQAYTPEIYAARLKQRGFSDESAQAFTQAYIQRDINIAKDYANAKAAEVYDEQIRKNLKREFEINAKNGVNINKDEAYRQHPMIRPDRPSIEQGGLKRDKLTVAREKLASEINVDKLNDEQKDVYDVFVGNKDKVTLQGKDLNDLYMLERGSRNAGVKKIMIKHAGIEKTGGLTNEELLGIMDVVRGGRIAEDSFEQFSDRIRYAYDLKENGVKFRVVIDEYNDGKKVFDYYSDRNFVDYQQDRRGLARTFDPHSRVQVPSATDEIISQKGNLVNEAETNGLSDGVSSIGDNASRAGGRQASDEQILRQGRRDTANASQTKRPAQSDEQVEQPGAAKADGQTNAAAATKQVVEKQGSGASIGGGLTANSNAHLGSGLVAGTLNSVDEDGNFSPERFAAGFLAGLVGGKAAAAGLRKMTPKLYNQILGAAEKMPQMANGNPRLLGKLYSNGKGVSLNSFAGEKAITANVGKLDQAKAMLEKGADEVEIWQNTGWFKDKDGAWKFEIGDGNAKLNPGFQSGGRLGELLEHEELFKAYPELKDVTVVKIGDATPQDAAYSVKDVAQKEKRGIYNVAFNNKKSTIIRKDLDVIDEIIKFEKGEADYMAHGERKSGYGALHIQKHLDTQNNGWVTKQEYLNMGQMLRKSTMEEADDKRIYTYFNDEGVRFRVVIGIGKNKERVISFYSNRKPLKAGLSYNSQNYDGNLPLNDDIIAQNGTKGYYSPAKNEIGLRDIGDKSTLMHEVQHAVQEMEDFARGGSRERIEGLLWYESGRLAYDLKKLAPPPEFYVLEKKRTTLSSKLFQAQDKVIEQNPLMENNIIDNIVDKKNIDELNLKNTKELNELKDVLAEYRDTNNALDDMLKNHPIFKERKKISDKLDALVKKDPYEEYKKLLGEVEARNVQNRLNLDGKAHPHETFDVNPNETIVSKEDGISYSRKIEEIKREHPNVEKELDESIAAMRKESFNDSNFKNSLLKTIDDFIAETKGHPASGDFRGVQGMKSPPVRTGLARPRSLATQELGKSVNLSDKQLAVLKNDIKNADFKVINESKIYFDKIGKDGDKKRFFVDIAQDGSLRVDAYAKSQVDNIPVKQSALEELADAGDAARLKNMSFEVKAAYRNELDPIKKEAILKTAELNKLKKAAQSGDKAAAAKFEEFKAKNLDKDGNIKGGLSLC